MLFSASRNAPLKHLRLHLLLPRHYNLLLYSTTTATSTSTHQQPPPIQVSLTESAGRGVFATRRIGAGDLIHTAKPFISYPSLSLLHCVCYFCLKKIGTVAAVPSTVPKTVKFCSHECQKLAKDFYDVEEHVDWTAYDAHCRTRGLKYPLLMKRLACMVISGATSADCLDILQPARLLNEMILEMEVEFDLLKESFTKSNFKDEVVSFLTREWYTSVLARIRINAFRVEVAGGSYEDLFSSAVASVEAAAAVGNAVYMLPSFYNHDCDPNVHIIWIENVNARLKALRDIEEGEELRICYIDASMDHDARQTILSQGFGFKCTCARCVSGD